MARKLSVAPETSPEPTPTIRPVSEAQAARLAAREARAADPRRDPALRRQADEAARATMAAIPADQPCQCGDPACDARVPVRRFAPGHDAKLHSRLLREAIELLAQQREAPAATPRRSRKAEATAAA